MITAVLLAAVLALYLYSTRTFRYWQKRGIKYERPIPLFGTDISNYFFRESFSQLVARVYWKYPNEGVVGLYRSSQPALVIRDPDIIKSILITNFDCFYARGLNLHNEPLLRNVLFADGDLWRLLRQCMTPAFTSGKLRAMFPLITERAAKLQATVLAASPHLLDARDLMTHYTIDIVGACGFGLDADSLNDENSLFRKVGIKIFKVQYKDIVITVLKSLFPVTFKYLKQFGKVEEDVCKLVRQIMEQRNYEPCGRKDFIDLLLEYKKNGKIIGGSMEKTKLDGSPEEATLIMTDELISAQVFSFFAAGFETSSSASSFVLHQLAFHPEVQRRAQEEVDRILVKHNNQFTYEAIKEMTYLKWTILEAMRIFPSPGFLLRKCKRRCTITKVGMEIDPGVNVVIPLQALHNDPQYFPEPEEFRPERFHSDQVNANIKYVYLPFGCGPRACIGRQLGMMQSLAGLAAVLARCWVSPAPHTKRHPRVDPKFNIVQSIHGGLPLVFHARETKNINYDKLMEREREREREREKELV